jgi:uncharacterized SAM-binding protein YcdF (DUF218 family)
MKGHGKAELQRRRRRVSPSFVLGFSVGVAVAWMYHTLTVSLGLGRPPPPLPAPLDPPIASGYHALVVPAGGQASSGPPAHVAARLEQAAHLYLESAYPKPYVITTAWGTPHKPCPHDAAGFERHEAADNARFLIDRGVQPAHILEESVSLETVGNAFFARVLHTETRGLRRLAVINNHFHMPRTRAVFEHVFRVPPRAGEPSTAYELEFVTVEDRLTADALEVRLQKEAVALPRFAPGGPWQQATPTMRHMHDWLYQENTAYATKRLLEERKPIDPALLKSY